MEGERHHCPITIGFGGGVWLVLAAVRLVQQLVPINVKPQLVHEAPLW